MTLLQSIGRSAARRSLRLSFLALTLSSLFALSDVVAQRLPLRTYTTAEGLPHNIINKIVRDSRGFLWFCTADGLSRFDGYEFVNFGTEQGLPHPAVTDLLETKEGEYWVATAGGLCKFNPNGIPTKEFPAGDSSAPPMFVLVRSATNDRESLFINTLLQSRDGTVWCGTRTGVFRVARSNNEILLQPEDVGGLSFSKPDDVNALLEDRFGTLWVGRSSGLYRRWPDGKSVHFGKQSDLLNANIHDLLEDHNGDVWVATRLNGLFQLANSEQYAAVKHLVDRNNGMDTNWVFDLFESYDHKLWAATNSGLHEFVLDAEKAIHPSHVYTKRNGFSYHEIADLAEDRDGNLWLGTVNGAMKLARGGFTTFGERDGICCINFAFVANDSELYLSGNVLGDERGNVLANDNVSERQHSTVIWRRIGWFNGERFDWVIPETLRRQRPGWSDKLVARALSGEWWIATSEGLYLFPATRSFLGLKTARPLVSFTKKDAFASQEVFCIFEDSRGDLWISTVGSNGNGLSRWERATRTLRDMTKTDGLPSLREKLPTAFAQDHAGSVWVGFSQGELGRYQDGRFAVFTTADGLPAGRVDNLYLDHAGRLWISLRRALVRVDDPTATHPQFITYTMAQGLSSNYVTAITEDHADRIYIGTSQGVDRLEPTSGLIKHYTTADGLAPGEVVTIVCDHQGSIWVGTTTGISKLQPEPLRGSQAPPVLIKGLSIGGAARHISAIGETDVFLPELSPNQNQLQIDFVGLSFVPGDVLRYQYRLEGAAGDWSQPSTQRTVNFANLAPGRYRFAVRAVNSDGTVSIRPSVIRFVILPPIWQRWWFITPSLAIIVAAAFLVHRYRISRLLELEQVRTRIATDLHDDIGAGLSRLAILSEVARHDAGETTVGERLGEIAQGSRQLVDSMSDIVWMVNPKRDQLRDLVQRTRRFASDVLTAAGIEFTFHAPEELDVKVGADVRRQLFLIFKEAINNVARHSGCTNADLRLELRDRLFIFTMNDNGGGFDTTKAAEGNGLMNMAGRARLIKGELLIDSRVGAGTTITLKAPLNISVEKRNGRLRGFPSA